MVLTAVTTVISGSDGPTSVFVAGRIGDAFCFPAILILLIFYGIYVGKMIIQKKRGIRTDQMARGKNGALFYTELILKIATYGMVLAETVSIVTGSSMTGQLVKQVGLCVALIGDIVFGSAVFTMKDSWRAGIAKEDHTELVTNGIYRWSRNPAFLGFDLVYIGILLMYFNPVLLVCSILAMVLFHLQILQEERFLSDTFGREYQEYRAHTCRYFGRKK